jgi:hypothetical protein
MHYGSLPLPPGIVFFPIRGRAETTSLVSSILNILGGYGFVKGRKGK